MRLRAASGALVLVVVAVGLAACSVPEGSEARPVDSDIAGLLTPQVTPTPRPTTAPPKPTKVTWVHGENLVQTQRLVPAKSRQQQLDAALFELASGPSPTEQRRNLISLLSPDLVVDGTVRRMRVVLDVERNGQTEQGGVTLAVGQLATTALSIPQVREVTFKVNGERTRVPVPGGGKEERVVRMRDYRRVLRGEL